MIVAIDGPAGSGKSTTARAVARRLGFRHLESGAFYRALTRAALDAGIAEDDWDALSEEQLDALGVYAQPAEGGFHLFLGHADVTDQLRSAEVNAHVSHIARVPAVRQWLYSRLRQAARGVDTVADGRDMGTVVFPDAEVKIFLTAEPRTRARRRLLDFGMDSPADADLDAETERLLARDRVDSERAVAPLRRAEGAVEIDTSSLSFQEQVDRIVQVVRVLAEKPR